MSAGEVQTKHTGVSPGSAGEYRLYTNAREGCWDVVLSCTTHEAAVFLSRARATWMAAALCEDLGVDVVVRDWRGEFVEEWIRDQRTGKARRPMVVLGPGQEAQLADLKDSRARLEEYRRRR